MTVVFLKSLIFIHVVISTNQVSLKRYFVLTDFRAPVISSVLYGLDSSLLCCLQCEKNINCTAVNYHTENRICELIKPGVTSISPTRSPGWIFYYSNSEYLSLSCIATAEQSSTYNSWAAEMAIDNRFRTNIYDKSCSCTKKEFDPWWMADYKMQLGIRGIKIWNRSDCCAARLGNLVIYVSPLPTGVDDSANQCATFVGPAQKGTNPITVNCAFPMTGRYVKIQMQATNFLTICEVELIF